jgi:phosphate transport system substrate-binding protein
LLALSALILADGSLAAPSPTQAASAEPDVYAVIEGTGSTWSQLIIDQWTADVQASGIPVVYTGGGSSKGRKDFANRTTDFAVTEIAYQGTDETGSSDTSLGREFGYLPLAAGGTAFSYQLKADGREVKNLRLSGSTIAKIFTNQITRWSDDAITADNNGRRLPDLPITPVVRSDGSGTTAQFTAWMDHQHPAIWRPFYGTAGATSYYPREGRAVGQSGSDQVMNTIRSATGNGTIGYVEYTYPVNARAPVVKVLNEGGYFVEPTPYNVAVGLTAARINNDASDPDYLTADLTGVYTNPDPRAYPLSSYSYAVIPTSSTDPRMTTAKRQSLVDFLTYAVCDGQARSAAYGYAPLPPNLVQAGFDQLQRLGAADPNVDVSDVDITTCNNPTIDPNDPYDTDDPDGDRLAEIAPQPQPCDRLGAGPCAGGPPSPAPATPSFRVRFTAPRARNGVYVVSPGLTNVIRVATNTKATPRYLRPVARDTRLRGPGVTFRSAGASATATAVAVRHWWLRVHIRPGDTVKKIGIRVGRLPLKVLLVRRGR